MSGRAPDTLEPARKWLMRAACHDAENPDLWHSNDESEIQEARRICREECPVAMPCLTDALRAEGNASARSRQGVVGGCTPAERRNLYTRRIAPTLPEGEREPKRRGPGRSLAPCGTEAAKARHRRNGETCVTCHVGIRGAP